MSKIINYILLILAAVCGCYLLHLILFVEDIMTLDKSDDMNSPEEREFEHYSGSENID